MRKILYSFVFIGAAAGALFLGPTPLSAADAGTKCYCVGGCEGYVYYNPCDGGLCSWSCNTEPE